MKYNNKKITLIENDRENSIINRVDEILKEFSPKMIPSTKISTSLTETQFDLIITNDHNADLLNEIKLTSPYAEIILISDNIPVELIHDDTIYGCLNHNFTDNELLLKVNSAIKHNQMRREIGLLKENIAMNYSFDNFVGSSKVIQKAKETIKKVSITEIPVHIAGARGTGKDLTARIIHHHSAFRKNKFIKIDCDQSSEQLLELELFGDKDKTKGIMAQADSDTIYFKNLDQMPLATQKRLYQFCQSSKIKMRFISSSSVDLNNLVEKKRFIEELYYQLAVITIKLPELTKRSDDIIELAEFLVRKISYQNNANPLTLTRSALELLINHSWPGNITELEATLKRALQLSQSKEITADEIIITGRKQKQTFATTEPESELIIKGKSTLMDEGQKTLIIKTLNNNNWNYSQTAQELGIGRTTLWRKVKKYNLKQETAV